MMKNQKTKQTSHLLSHKSFTHEAFAIRYIHTMTEPADLARFTSLPHDDQARLLLRLEAVHNALKNQIKTPTRPPIDAHQHYRLLLQESLPSLGLQSLIAPYADTLAEQFLLSVNWPTIDPTTTHTMEVPFTGTPRTHIGSSKPADLRNTVRRIEGTIGELQRAHLKGDHTRTSPYIGSAMALKQTIHAIGWKLEMRNPMQVSDAELSKLTRQLATFLRQLTLDERYGIREFARLGDHRFCPRVWMDTFTRKSDSGTLKQLAAALLTPSVEEGLDVNMPEKALAGLTAPPPASRRR